MYSISTSQFSFIQFAESDSVENCNWPASEQCLPVFSDEDIWTQWFINADTEEEADTLCDLTNSLVAVGLVEACTDGFLLEFTEKPERYRTSPTQLLYVWKHGLPGFSTVFNVGDCFHIKVEVADQSFCSNCLQRIGDDCHTSVIEYYGDENQFGFSYCASGNGEETDTDECDPTIIQFTNQATMTIPYTAFLQNKHGEVPTVEVWTLDGTELVKAGTRVAFDGFPVTEIRIDNGGPVSGVLKIM